MLINYFKLNPIQSEILLHALLWRKLFNYLGSPDEVDWLLVRPWAGANIK